MVDEARPKLPRATLRNDKLYVEGEKEPYFRDRTNDVRLRIDRLMIHRGYRDYRNRTGKVLTESLHGIATLEEDEFAVIGHETDDTAPIEFLLGPIPETETEHHWRATIGFHVYDWEFPLQKEGFWIQGYCTRQYIEDLFAAVRRGHVDNIRVGMETTMWTKDPPRMSGSPRTWHLASPTDGTSTHDPALENGYISSLAWEENFRAPKTNDDEITAPKPQLVELPARVYSMLAALLVIAAALLGLTFLRY
jgi:hypothetical protein